MAYVTAVSDRGTWLDIAHKWCAFAAESWVTECRIVLTNLLSVTGVGWRDTLLDFVRVRETGSGQPRGPWDGL